MIIGPFILLAILGLITYAVIMNIPWSRKNVVISTIPMVLLASYILYYNIGFIWDKKGPGILRTRYVATSS